jgi:DNA-binding TFAR19-related protein (PDSD5 family)
VPSSSDIQKNKQNAGQAKEKREDVHFNVLQSLLQREALERLAKLELENPKKVKYIYHLTWHEPLMLFPIVNLWFS